MGLRMPKTAKVLCTYCDKKMDVGTSFCPHCEHPSQWATHDERVSWELSNYRKLNTVPVDQSKAEVTPLRRVRLDEPAHARTHMPNLVQADATRARAESRVLEPVRSISSEQAPAAVEPRAPRVSPPPNRKPGYDRVVVARDTTDDAPDAPAPARKRATKAVAAEPKTPAVKKAPARARVAKPKVEPDVEVAVAAAEPVTVEKPKPVRAPRPRPVAAPAAVQAAPEVAVVDMVDQAAKAGHATLSLMEEQVELLRSILDRVSSVQEHLTTTSNGNGAVPAPEKRRGLRRRSRA
jgi:hypothetical protein